MWPFRHVEFDQDGTLTETEPSFRASEDDTAFEGYYDVLNTLQVVIRFRETTYEVGQAEMVPQFTTVRLELRELKKSVFHAYELGSEDGGVVLLSDAFTVAPGLERNVNGVSVITVGAVPGMTIANVRIREAPNTSARLIAFSKEDDIRELEYCPEGERIRILALQ